jgi:hypothetical protein
MTQHHEITDNEKVKIHQATNQYMKIMHKQLGGMWKHVVLEMHRRIIADAFHDKDGADLNKYFQESKKIVRDTIVLIKELNNKKGEEPKEAANVE